MKPPLSFRLKLRALRVVCAVRKHRRVDITTYDGDRVIIRDCCRRCAKEFGVTTGPRRGPRPVHRHVISKRAA